MESLDDVFGWCSSGSRINFVVCSYLFGLKNKIENSTIWSVKTSNYRYITSTIYSVCVIHFYLCDLSHSIFAYIQQTGSIWINKQSKEIFTIRLIRRGGIFQCTWYFLELYSKYPLTIGNSMKYFMFFLRIKISAFLQWYAQNTLSYALNNNDFILESYLSTAYTLIVFYFCSLNITFDKHTQHITTTAAPPAATKIFFQNKCNHFILHITSSLLTHMTPREREKNM